jgi:hypothetical protein
MGVLDDQLMPVAQIIHRAIERGHRGRQAPRTGPPPPSSR